MGLDKNSVVTRVEADPSGDPMHIQTEAELGPFFVAAEPCTICGVSAIPGDGVTANIGGYAVITVYRHDADGSNRAKVGDLSTAKLSLAATETVIFDTVGGAIDMLPGQYLSRDVHKVGVGVELPKVWINVAFE